MSVSLTPSSSSGPENKKHETASSHGLRSRTPAQKQERQLKALQQECPEGSFIHRSDEKSCDLRVLMWMALMVTAALACVLFWVELGGPGRGLCDWRLGSETSEALCWVVVAWIDSCYLKDLITSSNHEKDLSHELQIPKDHDHVSWHHFIAIGDWGRDGQCCQRDVALEMERAAAVLPASHIVSTGDNFYPSGIKSLHDEQVETSWSSVYMGEEAGGGVAKGGGRGDRDNKNKNIRGKKNSLILPWHFVLGNHDWRGSVESQVNLSLPHWNLPSRYFSRIITDPNATPSPRGAGGYEGGGDDSGSFLGELFFIDTTPLLNKYKKDHRVWRNIRKTTNSYRQLQWLENALRTSKAAWKIVIGHHPLYTYGAHHGENWGPNHAELKRILEENRIHGFAVVSLSDKAAMMRFVSGEDGSVLHTETLLAGNGPNRRLAS